MQNRTNKLYLLLGSLLYWLSSLGFIWGELASSDMGQFLLSLLIICSLIAHLWFFNQHSKHDQTFEAEQIFTKVLTFGIITFAIAIVPFVLGKMDILLTYKWEVIIRRFSAYIYLLFFLYTFTIYRKLMHIRKDTTIIRQWDSLLVVLVLASLCNLKGVPFSNTFPILLYIMGAIMLLPLIFRVKWIALLKGKEKWLILLFLLVLLTINTALIGLYVYSDLGVYTDQGINQSMFLSNVFMGLVIGGVSAYHLASFLILLFYLPLSSVIEEQKSEIKSYQEISKVLHKEGDRETFDHLFKVCFATTLSNSGWYIYIVDGKGEIVHTNNIKDVDIQLLSQRIGFEQLMQIEAKRGYYSFPDLKKRRYVFTNEMPYRSLLVLPIFTQNNSLKGVICLLKDFVYGFDADLINLCKSYIDQAKLAFENTRLIKQTIEDARYKEEIEIATKVQEALIPSSFPKLEYCEIAAFNQSARDVGGDYYDYSMIDDYSMAVVIGDVSGKGAAAAFHMAQMKGIFQALIQLCLPADNFLVMANHSISNCLEKNRFITLIYLAFDFGFRNFTYSRAGHCPILYYNAEQDEVSYLQDEGMGLGIIRNNSYTNFVEAHQVDLHVGDVIVLYTDGLVEGRSNSEKNEPFGYERLKNCLRAYNQQSAAEIKTKIQDKFNLFTKGRNDTDDTAVLVIKIKHL